MPWCLGRAKRWAGRYRPRPAFPARLGSPAVPRPDSHRHVVSSRAGSLVAVRGARSAQVPVTPNDSPVANARLGQRAAHGSSGGGIPAARQLLVARRWRHRRRLSGDRHARVLPDRNEKERLDSCECVSHRVEISISRRPDKLGMRQVWDRGVGRNDQALPERRGVGPLAVRPPPRGRCLRPALAPSPLHSCARPPSGKALSLGGRRVRPGYPWVPGPSSRGSQPALVHGRDRDAAGLLRSLGAHPLLVHGRCGALRPAGAVHPLVSQDRTRRNGRGARSI